MTKRKHDKIEGGNTFFDSLKRKKLFKDSLLCYFGFKNDGLKLSK